MTARESYDLVIIGAGFFGTYAALHFGAKGMRVLLLDREQLPWNKASSVNQARVHTGYHYPRSIKTARMANENRNRFLKDHAYAINDTFDKFYAIERRNSLTNAAQFERFCNKIDIPYTPTYRPDLFNHEWFEALYVTEEFSFDSLLIRQAYLSEVEKLGIETQFGWRPRSAEIEGGNWHLELEDAYGEETRSVATPNVINATYANLNTVNRMFDFDEIPVTHELAEMVLLHSDVLSNIGLTIMDGPFVSIMPYGRSGLLSLSSVRYTHTSFSAELDPRFECQTKRGDCTPQSVRNCTACRFKPPSNAMKMLKQLQTYLAKDVNLYRHGELMTVKTKLLSSMRDDGRPTDIRTYSKTPFFGCVFSGKINSIYEVEGFALND